MKEVVIDIRSDRDITYVCPKCDVRITLVIKDPGIKCRKHGLTLVPLEANK